MPCAAKRATSVQPSFGRTARSNVPTSSATSGSERFGAAAGDALTISTSSAPSSSASSRLRASSIEQAGANRRFTTISQSSGTTLLAIPPSIRTTCSDSRYSSPSTSTVGASYAATPGEQRRALGGSRSLPSRAGPSAPVRPRTSARVERPLAPGLDPSARWARAGSRGRRRPARVRSANRCRSPLCSSATSSPS